MLEQEIEEDYYLCLNKPVEYQAKVDAISNLFRLTGKNKLKSDNCPVYVVGRFDKALIVTFGLNPGQSNPREEAQARKSWRDYQDLYLNYFKNFKQFATDPNSKYYTAYWHVLSGLTNSKLTIENKAQLFDRYLVNMNLIPYHSDGIQLPSNFTKEQFEFLRSKFIKGFEFISQFKPKLVIFNGQGWYTLLIKYNQNSIQISNLEKVQVTEKFGVYLFELSNSGIPCVLFDKFLAGPYWGITDQDRNILIPKLIHSRFKNLLMDLEEEMK